MKVLAAVFCFVAMVLANDLRAQEIKRDFIDPVPQSIYPTAVKVKAGTMIFLAGHTASLPQIDADHGNFEIQVRRTFDAIKTTLSKAGATLDDVVSLSVFMTDLRYVPEFDKLTPQIFKKARPAVTFIEVSHLARPQLMIEIQSVAVIP